MKREKFCLAVDPSKKQFPSPSSALQFLCSYMSFCLVSLSQVSWNLRTASGSMLSHGLHPSTPA
jgi:hypothetical protein